MTQEQKPQRTVTAKVVGHQEYNGKPLTSLDDPSLGLEVSRSRSTGSTPDAQAVLPMSETLDRGASGRPPEGADTDGSSKPWHFFLVLRADSRRRRCPIKAWKRRANDAASAGQPRARSHHGILEQSSRLTRQMRDTEGLRRVVARRLSRQRGPLWQAPQRCPQTWRYGGRSL